MKRTLLLAAFLTLFSIAGYATKYTITTADYAFNPAILTINPGDTVMFLWTSGTHTTTSTSVPMGAATWDSPIDQVQQTFIYVPTVSGVYSYTCSPHSSMGMSGSFTVRYPTSIPVNLTDASFMFWPNPAHSSTHIKFNEVQQYVTIAVTDITGTVVMSHNYSNVAETDIDISNLPQGRYLLYATTGSDIYSSNLVVE